jgi:hypothetical protein
MNSIVIPDGASLSCQQPCGTMTRSPGAQQTGALTVVADDEPALAGQDVQ